MGGGWCRVRWFSVGGGGGCRWRGGGGGGGENACDWPVVVVVVIVVAVAVAALLCPNAVFCLFSRPSLSSSLWISRCWRR